VKKLSRVFILHLFPFSLPTPNSHFLTYPTPESLHTRSCPTRFSYRRSAHYTFESFIACTISSLASSVQQIIPLLRDHTTQTYTATREKIHTHTYIYISIPLTPNPTQSTRPQFTLLLRISLIGHWPPKPRRILAYQVRRHTRRCELVPQTTSVPMEVY
jgi:hypothetical protein